MADIIKNIPYLARRISPLFDWKSYAKTCGHEEWSRHQSKLHYITHTPEEEILGGKIIIENYLTPNYDDLAVCLCYFSYCRYKKPLKNLLVVLDDLYKANIPYFVIELLYPNQESIVPYATKIVCAETVMFHKENLWNLIEKSVPDKYSKLLFLDGDIRFSNKNWYDKTSESLNVNTVIQPMDLVYNMGLKNSLCGALQKNITKLNLADHHPGYAIGIDRNLFHRIGGFYERAIVGSGDTIFWNGILKTSDSNPNYSEHQTDPHIKNYDFKDHYKILKSNKDHIKLGCVSNNIAIHLQHGSFSNRKYRERYKTFPTYNYEIFKNRYGIYEWKNNTLDEYMRKYFESRKEDEL